MQNYTYKAIVSGPRYSNMKEGRNNRIRIETPVIEHTFPNEMIVDITKLTSLYRYTMKKGYWDCSNMLFIDKSQFHELFSDKIFYPTEYPKYEFEKYLGAVLIHSAQGYDILTYVGEYYKEDKILLLPIHMLKYGQYEEYMTKVGYLPKRNVKCFLSNEDLNEHFDKANKKADAEREIYSKAADEARRVAPIFSFKTPKFKIKEIVKKTEYLKDVQVGDIIYAEIPVIKESDDRKFGALKGIGTQTNWVTLYINDKKINTISPKTFPSLFFYNVIVEEV